VAQLFGWEDPEAAVRIIILMLMFAFDPLALMLIISGSITYQAYMKHRTPTVEPEVEEVFSDEPVTELDVIELDATAEELLALLEADRNPPEPEVYDPFAHLPPADPYERQWSFPESKRVEETVELVEEIIDERELEIEEAQKRLLEWKNELAAEQEALENRRQELEVLANATVDMMDGATDKDKVLRMLEANPEVLQDIIDVVDSRRQDDRIILHEPKGPATEG
jgi:hypothetical protein